jgi:hypothetical protein
MELKFKIGDAVREPIDGRLGVVSDAWRGGYSVATGEYVICVDVDFSENSDSTVYFEEDLEFADRQAEAHWIARKLCEGEL